MSVYIQDTTSGIQQGDIIHPVKVKDWLSWWPDEKEYPVIIMTPACDIAQDKADYHRFCVLYPFPIFLYLLGNTLNLTPNHWNGIDAVSKGKSEKLEQRLSNAIKNSWARYHYLPSEDDVFTTDRIIDFEIVGTIPVGEVDKSQRIAKLTSPYKEELIHRFSHHIMRIGTPDSPKSVVKGVIDNYIGSSGLKLAV